MTTAEAIVSGAVAVVLIVAYAVLTALGIDGNVLLGLLGGQGISSTIHAVAPKVAS